MNPLIGRYNISQLPKTIYYLLRLINSQLRVTSKSKLWPCKRLLFDHTAWATQRDKYVQNDKSNNAQKKGGINPNKCDKPFKTLKMKFNN